MGVSSGFPKVTIGGVAAMEIRDKMKMKMKSNQKSGELNLKSIVISELLNITCYPTPHCSHCFIKVQIECAYYNPTSCCYTILT